MNEPGRFQLRPVRSTGPPNLDPRCVSCTAPDADTGTLAVSDHWKIVLHPDQTVPGALLIVSRRHVPTLGELTDAEGADFFRVFRLTERALVGELGATLVNVSCLRNFAYRTENPDPPLRNGRPNPHVHWHVAPRFDAPVVIAGEEFTDVDFGDELRWRARRISSDVTDELCDRLRRHLLRQ